MRMSSMRTLWTASLAVTLAGCSLAPTYERPAAPVSGTYPTGPAYGAPDQSAARPDGVATADIGWREFFTDPLLQQLIEMSLANNRDLRIAALNVESAQAQYRIERANLFPSVGVGGQANIQRTPGDLSISGSPSTSRSYSVGASFSDWELDLFGRIRSLSDAALQEYFGLEDTREATQLSLIAEVANAYMTFRADQELLALTEETLATQKQSYDLTLQGYDGGVNTALDLSQAEVSVRTAERNYAVYTRQVANDRNALVLLLGQPLDANMERALEQANRLDDNALPTALPAGLPSDLLTRRPDVRAAEHQLMSANANIGAARAAFFPRIGLTASGGTSSSSLDGLFKAGSGTWAFSPLISVPIFAGGQLRASLDVAEIQKDARIAQYERTIQTGFREVADALAGRGTLDQQIRSQEQLVAATQRAYDVSDQLFRGGISNYLTLLDSQRSLYDAQQALVTTRLSRISNLITLYKVLGGGWTERTPASAAAPGTAATGTAATGTDKNMTATSSTPSAQGPAGSTSSSYMRPQPGSVTRVQQPTSGR